MVAFWRTGGLKQKKISNLETFGILENWSLTKGTRDSAVLKLSLAVKFRGHSQRILNDHVYSLPAKTAVRNAPLRPGEKTEGSFLRLVYSFLLFESFRLDYQFEFLCISKVVYFLWCTTIEVRVVHL